MELVVPRGPQANWRKHEKKSIAVVMTCHNRRAETLECLEALVSAHATITYSTLHIYLVDDGSQDGTASAILNKYPNIAVIQGGGNLYWTRGMHAAFSRAMANDHDFYLWLNDDVQLFENALESLFTCYESERRIYGTRVVIVGTVIDPDTHEITYGGHTRMGSKWLRRNQRVYSGLCALPCESFSGNCILLPREVVASVGNLDPTFHHAFGDHDYGYRCSALNIRIVVCRDLSGTCRERDGSIRLYDHDRKKHLTELSLPKRIKLSLHPKHYPLRSWFVFCRRHLGPLWIFRFALPYLTAIAPKLF
jgi:GT2 family glycosyltransferase